VTDIPVAADQITSAWLDSLLAPGGWPRIRAVRLTRLPGANPKITQVFRARLSFARSGPAPATSVVVKIPAQDPAHRKHEAAERVYERESEVYRLFADRQGALFARVHADAYDADTGLGAIVLEDLGPAPPANGVAPTAALIPAVESLASIHAAFWQSPRAAAAPWLRSDKIVDLWGEPHGMYAAGCERFAKGRDVSPRLRRISEAIGKRLGAIIAELDRRPPTLIHGDLHPGNLISRGGLDRPVIIDWQCAASAGCTSDLAKLLLHAPPDALVRDEARLLRRYQELTCTAGVTGYPFERFERDYRLAQAATFANYAGSAFMHTGPDVDGFDISMGQSLRSVSAAIEVVFPTDFNWP